MRTTTLQNLPLPSLDRAESARVKGGLNPQPLPPRIWRPIVVNPIFRFVGR